MPKPKAEFEEFELYKGKVKGKFYPGSHQYWVNGVRKTGVTTIIGVFDKSAALVSWATDLARDFLLDKIEGGFIIKQEAVIEACQLHNQKKEEAASIGTEVHDWIENHIKGNNPPMPETREAQIGVNSFLEWISENKVKFISAERVVYSREHDYIGKMDIEAKVNGKLCLIDIKTSNGIYNTYSMQTAAYVRADEEERKIKYQGRWIIRLSKETEKEYDLRMEKKNLTRSRNGKEDFNYPPYQVFEAKYLDDTKGNMERDFDAFLACKTLKVWDNLTGFWASKK